MTSRRKVILLSLISWAMILLAFLFGVALGARYSTFQEMHHLEESLVKNFPLLTYCRMESCDQELRQLLIQQSDISLQKYTMVEKELQESIMLDFQNVVWILTFLSNSSLDDLTKSEELKEKYNEIKTM